MTDAAILAIKNPSAWNREINDLRTVVAPTTTPADGHSKSSVDAIRNRLAQAISKKRENAASGDTPQRLAQRMNSVTSTRRLPVSQL